ncbi:hypothetical protein D7Y13_27320 [Corallococcus praedator]|uniref:Uncharacterized protein n=1 Tax=Corallococcus praedator TaxID=2316724 RepID=A0ABX9QBG4_9BACT|nr:MULTISPECIES: hypothetical protein [Corallococcus]RKH20256.1 hypothetical protein D7X74_04765 [Corallococcus sp. CA047B]RKH32563.1 hypothetical protein D7X75_15420 [Corallococcus sp. CA031C]RKH99854.1 hypothetical protein D7Y13_27320 [Corallococcus praedator]
MHRFAPWSVAFFALLLLHAAPAQAQVDVQCTGTLHQTWTPGLKALPRVVAYTNSSDYDACTTSVAAITSGTLDVRASFNNSCVANLGPSQATIAWSDGSSSTFTFQGVGANVVGNLQVFTAVGRVTHGRFQGDQVLLVNRVINTDLLACLWPQGLTSLTGSTTLTFTRL